MSASRGFFQRIAEWLTPPATADAAPATHGAPAAPIARNVDPSYVVIDVETTGLSARQHRVLELAVVRLDARGDVLDEWSSRFNPEGPVGATHIHGITDADVRHAPRFRDLAGDVQRLVGEVPVIAHNARFDLAFLRSELSGAGVAMPYLQSICTLEASHRFLPDLDRRKLADCCSAVGVRLTGAHSALGDARAAAGLFRHYLHAAKLDAAPLLSSNPPRRSHDSGPRRPRRSVPPQRITSRAPRSRPLLTEVTAPSLRRLAKGAAPGVAAYLEALLEALEDGILTAGERESLGHLGEMYDLEPSDLDAAHRALLLAVAHRAVIDGRVSGEEQSQLRALSDLLAQPASLVADVLREAEVTRDSAITAKLRPLPEHWSLGEPLRVGDRVAFTGCEDAWRDRIEVKAARAGVRVMSNVSGLTALLVTDGSFAGTKLEAARHRGTRIVEPRVFETLLEHLQPRLDAPDSRASAKADNAAPADPAAVRRWAKANGIEVGDRGRIPRALIDQYLSATQHER